MMRLHLFGPAVRAGDPGTRPAPAIAGPDGEGSGPAHGRL